MNHTTSKISDDIQDLSHKEASERELPGVEVPEAYATWRARLTLLLLCLLSGVGYLILQQIVTGSIRDTVFVSMLIGATGILLYGLKYLRDYLVSRGIRFYNFVLSTDDPEEAYRQHKELCMSVLNARWMTVAGVIYGAIVGSAPFLFSLWPSIPILRVLLSIFLFTVNFATGVAFYGLIDFFIHAVRMGKMIEVDIWKVNKPSTEFLLGATRRISILGGVYAGISNTSILFSVIPISYLVILYFIFSGVTILASVVIPSIPIARKIRQAKMEAINNIEDQLHETLKRELDKAKSNNEEINTDKFESLLTMKEKIEDIHSWPFRVKSIMAGFSVIFFSSIPLIIEVVLQYVISI